MHNELTNLLPPERQRALSKEYFFRIGVVITVAVTTLTLVAAVLLVPTYLFLTGSAHTKREHLANIESKLSSADEKALSVRLATLSSNVASLIALSKAPSVSATMRTILAVSHPDVVLSGFSYTPSVGKNSFGTLEVSGSSSTRDSLRRYQLALQDTSFARSATLPVSVYAQDTDITFTITITLAP